MTTRAERRARQRRADRRRANATPTHVLDADDQVVEVGGHCGLTVDLPASDVTPQRGDWVATQTGSRYVVDDVRPIRRRTQTLRYRLRCLRLPRDTRPPAEAHVIWLTWFPRGRRS